MRSRQHLTSYPSLPSPPIALINVCILTESDVAEEEPRIRTEPDLPNLSNLQPIAFCAEVFWKPPRPLTACSALPPSACSLAP